MARVCAREAAVLALGALVACLCYVTWPTNALASRLGRLEGQVGRMQQVLDGQMQVAQLQELQKLEPKGRDVQEAQELSLLHKVVQEKESAMPASFRKQVAEECEAAMRHADDLALWLRVAQEHEKSSGKDCRNNDKRCKAFMGQSLQDLFFYTVLWRHMDRPGVYLDLAANDFRYISNSYFADHCLKFDGVCVEPQGEYWANLDKRRRCAVVKTCVAEKRRDVKFKLKGVFGGVSGEMWGEKDKRVQGGKETTLTCETLAEIFRKYHMTHVDFLSLDVQGLELQCLQGIDWSSARIDTVLVERNDNPALVQFLWSQGYRNATTLRKDTVFVHQRATKLQQRVEEWNQDMCPKINDVLRSLRRGGNMYLCS